MVEFRMGDPKDSGLDRVRFVLNMRVEDATDLLRFGVTIADFTTEELIVLASNLPTHTTILVARDYRRNSTAAPAAGTGVVYRL
jgi:hypothetical protein